jgi:two-component system phosphate regulon sensor histidine kinase PhoR
MSKKIFILIVVLMSISLIGIITVQLYWINNAVESKKAQFKNDVFKALASTADRIQSREKDKLYEDNKDIFENIALADKAKLKNYLFQQFDKRGNQRFSVGTTILEQNFKIPTDFLDHDSIIVKRTTTKKDFFRTESIKSQGDLIGSKNEERFSFYLKGKEQEKRDFELALEGVKENLPITKRVSNRELNATLGEELSKRNINIDYKYGVYSNDGLATPLKSGYYTIDKEKSESYPLLKNIKGEYYRLYVDFPNRNQLILSGISNILLLSLFFIFIIIIAFSSSLYQLVRQKKISEIKTDFINNMTHEFKTPIATINLALDSIKNPKIIDNKDKVMRYVGMIREENKRMHAQVENVLRISRLEKKQIEISKEVLDFHDIIEDAITHISLLINDRNGSISSHFKAIVSEISGNQFHLTNLVVNILENALKYSEGEPKIDIYTESTNKFFVFKIKDEGIGMAKNAQKHIFDKFYREQKGNIHNVKGHGLGLAYVKEILDNHNGTIFVESEKGKGSIFTVKLPLI